MNNMVFSTGGDWDSTTLYNNGMEVLATQLFVEIHAGRDGYGDETAGGISAGGEITAIVRPQANPMDQLGIFPGRLEMNFPNDTMVIENTHPMFAFEYTRVWFNGVEATNNVVDIYVDINAADNVVQGYITLYKPHWIAADEVATYNVL
ncbi:MAG TPA: hypothetical protein VKU00_22035 [Chthonomonadaceae bacterium]|nr:hypothetical protein [Chthonomonadaceae bacterium]